MSGAVDLTLLSGALQAMERDVRLMRLQLDSLAQRTSGLDGRMEALDRRLGALEQTSHALIGEMARDFGQVSQQLTRLESRLDVLDAGLTGLRSDIAENTAHLVDLLREMRR